MAKINQSTVKNVNIHQSKIDVVKFDGTINFDMLKCEVMDVLTASYLEDSLLFEKKPKEISEKDWDKMNPDNVWHHQIFFDIGYEVLCDDRNFARKI